VLTKSTTVPLSKKPIYLQRASRHPKTNLILATKQVYPQGKKAFQRLFLMRTEGFSLVGKDFLPFSSPFFTPLAKKA